MTGTVEQIKAMVFEDCSEDANGSWELWWGVKGEFSKADQLILRGNFVAAIQQLIEDKKLISARHLEGGKFVVEVFDPDRLDREVGGSDSPDGNEFYWFYAAI